MPYAITQDLHLHPFPTIKADAESKDMYKSLVENFKRENILWGHRFRPWMGHPLPAPSSPIRVQVQTDHTELPNFIGTGIGYAVDKVIRDEIERLEPGVHAFGEVELKLKDGTPVEKPYWVLNVRTQLDTIDRAKSAVEVGCDNERDPRLTTLRPTHPPSEKGMKGPVHLFARGEVVSGHHVWCEYKFRQQLVISNALYQRLEEVGATGFEIENFYGDA